MNDVQKQIALERDINIGDMCRAFWTNCGHYYEAEVKLLVINAKSYQVEVTKAIDGYPVGKKLNVPSFLNTKRWTWNNRLAPK